MLFFTRPTATSRRSLARPTMCTSRRRTQRKISSAWSLQRSGEPLVLSMLEDTDWSMTWAGQSSRWVCPHFDFLKGKIDQRNQNILQRLRNFQRLDFYIIFRTVIRSPMRQLWSTKFWIQIPQIWSSVSSPLNIRPTECWRVMHLKINRYCNSLFTWSGFILINKFTFVLEFESLVWFILIG